MNKDKLTELRSISERLKTITRDYSTLVGEWSSASEQQMLQHLQSVEKMLKQQIKCLEEYEKISFDELIDFRKLDK